jgi:hypothetical protein
MRSVRRVGGRRAQATASPRPSNPSNTSEARTVGYTYTIKRLARCASFNARSLSPRTTHPHQTLLVRFATPNGCTRGGG